jgi:hypothetical protein
VNPSHKRTHAVLQLLCLFWVALVPSLNAAAISVSGTTVVKDGKPYRGIGVNYFDVFRRTLIDRNDRTGLDGLTYLAKQDIPFVRFSASGYWPREMRLFTEDREAYLARLDAVVRLAESLNIGLIPSLFWNVATVPDLVDEPLSALGDRNSRTTAWMREYTRTIVSRYSTSKAIWAWEFGNELNLFVDLANPRSMRAAIDESRGTRKARDRMDDITTDDATVAWQEFAATVRRIDSSRPIITGNSIPRPIRYFTKARGPQKDTLAAQFADAIDAENPAAFNIVSIHVYPEIEDKYRYAPGEEGSIAQVLPAMVSAAAISGRPLFVGEFGVSDADGGLRGPRRRLHELIEAIVDSGASLAAAWVFDYRNQETTISFDASKRAYVLEEIKTANTKLGGALNTSRPKTMLYPSRAARPRRADLR